MHTPTIYLIFSKRGIPKHPYMIGSCSSQTLQSWKKMPHEKSYTTDKVARRWCGVGVSYMDCNNVKSREHYHRGFIYLGVDSVHSSQQEILARQKTPCVPKFKRSYDFQDNLRIEKINMYRLLKINAHVLMGSKVEHIVIKIIVISSLQFLIFGDKFQIV